LEEEISFQDLQDSVTESMKSNAVLVYPPYEGNEEEDDDYDFLFSVEDLVGPIINIFDDKLGRECIAVNYGFCSYNSESLSDNKLRELQDQAMMKIFISLLILLKNYKISYLMSGIGMCLDSSYVEKMHQDRWGTSIIFSMGGNEYIDKYYWQIDDKQINRKLLYEIIPKHFITLPVKDPLSINLSKSDLFRMQMGIKSGRSSKDEKTKQQEKIKREEKKEQKNERIRRELTDEITYFLKNFSTYVSKHEKALHIPNYRLTFALYKLIEYKKLIENQKSKPLIKDIDDLISKINGIIQNKKINKENQNQGDIKEKENMECPECGLKSALENSFCLKCGYYFV
jgi:hypothetical protein